MPTGPRTARLHHLDALRALLILLGIPYHASLAFAPTHWLVNMPTTATGFWWLSQFLHLWRMPSFFFIAGLFAAWTLGRRGPRAWLRVRVVRLGLPLVAGIVLINVPTALLLGLSSHSRYLDPSATFGNGFVLAPLVQHLWFLIVLVVFSVLHAVVAVVVRRMVPSRVAARLLQAQRVVRGMTQRLGAGRHVLILLAAVACVLLLSALWDAIPVAASLSDVFGDVGTDAAFYVLGVLVALKADALERLSLTPPIRVLSAAGVIAVAYAALAPVGDPVVEVVTAAVRAGLCCTILLAILCLARRFASAESPRTTVIVNAALVVYLVHQPVIVFTELALARTRVPLLLEFLITIGAAAAIAFGFYALVRRNRVARLLFTGSSRPLPPTRGLFARAARPELTRVAVD